MFAFVKNFHVKIGNRALINYYDVNFLHSLKYELRRIKNPHYKLREQLTFYYILSIAIMAEKGFFNLVLRYIESFWAITRFI